MAEMTASVAVALVMVVLFETETLLPGVLPGEGNAAFLCLSAMEIITICMLPLALRLFKIKRVGADLAAGRERALALWGSVRMMMMCLPLVANVLMYYLFDLKPAFFYMAVICLIALVFVYPSKDRCLSETGGAE